MPAGYSGTPLPQKLGIKAGARVLVVSEPNDFIDNDLVPMPEEVVVVSTLRATTPCDVILCFCKDQAAIRKHFDKCRDRLVENGGLWVCWPKKASGVKTDIDETFVREFGLQSGLVDNKVCAVNEVWSGLRFVIRIKDRAKPSRK
ncbi:MAG: DUF3052 family protein [Phycisphaeraceae bacterium]|nr:DUF3052 family protein [Phycisphaerales bacterium]MCB9861281.1 DUF3052 family protein [Phycisphaeraceae bacterium]